VNPTALHYIQSSHPWGAKTFCRRFKAGDGCNSPKASGSHSNIEALLCMSLLLHIKTAQVLCGRVAYECSRHVVGQDTCRWRQHAATQYYNTCYSINTQHGPQSLMLAVQASTPHIKWQMQPLQRLAVQVQASIKQDA